MCFKCFDCTSFKPYCLKMESKGPMSTYKQLAEVTEMQQVMSGSISQVIVGANLGFGSDYLRYLPSRLGFQGFWIDLYQISSISILATTAQYTHRGGTNAHQKWRRRFAQAPATSGPRHPREQFGVLLIQMDLRRFYFQMPMGPGNGAPRST